MTMSLPRRVQERWETLLSPTLRGLLMELSQLATGQLASLIVGVVALVLTTRALGAEGRGAYSWLLTVTGFAAQGGTLVVPLAVRKLGTTLPRAQWPALAGTFAGLILMGTVLTLPLLGWAHFQAAGAATGWLLELAWLAVPAMALAAGLSTLVQMQNSWQGRILPPLLPKLVQVAITIGLAIAGALTLTSAVAIQVGIATLGLALWLYYLRLPLRDWRFKPELLHRQGLFLALVWLATLCTWALPKIAVLLLPHYAGLAATGWYGLASNLFEVATIPVAFAGHVLTSHFSRQSGSGSRPGWRLLLQFSGLIAAASLVVAVLATWFVPWVFGAGFAPTVQPLQWLMVALIAAGLATVSQSRLVAHNFVPWERTRHPRRQLLLQVGGMLVPPLLGLAVATVALFYLLPASVGGAPLAAAQATLLGYVVYAVASLLALMKLKPAVLINA